LLAQPIAGVTNSETANRTSVVTFILDDVM
jgi:hypothetical protein